MAGNAPVRQSQRLRKGQNPHIEAPNEKEKETAAPRRGEKPRGGSGRGEGTGRGAPATPFQPPPPPLQKKRPAPAPTNPFESRPVQKLKQASGLSVRLAEIEAEAAKLRRQKEMRARMIAGEIEELDLVDEDEDEDKDEEGAYEENNPCSSPDLFSPIRPARTHGYDGAELSLRRQRLEIGKKDLQCAHQDEARETPDLIAAEDFMLEEEAVWCSDFY